MTISPTGPGLGLLLVSIILGALSVIIVAIRLVIRKRIKGIGSDDWLMLVGLVSILLEYGPFADKVRYFLYSRAFPRLRVHSMVSVPRMMS